MIDWGVFHVKHDYLAQWRQFRRALLQRNMQYCAEQGPDELLEPWDREMALAATAVDQHRHEYLHAAEYRSLSGLAASCWVRT